MITFDGDRSLKRKWFAKKQLANIQEIDVPAKAVQWDGFNFKVWQLGEELNGGRVTAPMGAVVLCSSENGVKISVADCWNGGFTSNSDLYTIYYPADGNSPLIKVFDMPTEEDVIADENSTVKFRPMGMLSPYGLIDGNTLGPDTVWVRDQVCLPNLIPYKQAEAFWISVDDNVFIDLNNNGSADFPKYIFDNTLIFYSSNGSNLGGRKTVSLQVGGGDPMAGATQPWRITQQLSSDWQVQHQIVSYEAEDSRFICAWNFQFPNTWPIYLDEVIPSGTMPTELRTILLDIEGITASWPLGYYSFLHNGEQVFLHVNNATNTFPWTASSPSAAYFSAHPEDESWKLSYTYSVGSLRYVIDSSQFISLLDSMTPLDVLGDWEVAKRMLGQFVPYPNATWACPYDSIMFHASDGNIYVWTRKYGAVYFSPAGLFSASVIVPTEVSAENGVRPEITYAGSFDSVPLYLCVCNKVKEEIKAVYYGSPFTSWTKLPGVDTWLTLVYVRPAKVSPTEIFLIGVVKETIDEVEYYSFACLDWALDSEGVASTDLWKKLGRLPFSVTDNDNFSAALFGGGALVDNLTEYLSPPPTLPQMPVGPYDKYAIGLP
jgi:hypothetical protein